MVRRQKVTVLRHGQATAPPPGMPYVEEIRRHLTKEGVRQAQERRVRLRNPNFDLVLCSTAYRCVETAIEIGGVGYRSYPLRELCYRGPDTSDGKALGEMFSKLGHASYGDYRELDTGRTIERQSKRVWRKATQLILKHDARRTLIVNHNPFVAALGYEITKEHKPWARTFTDTEFKEAEGFTLTIDGGYVVGLNVHR